MNIIIKESEVDLKTGRKRQNWVKKEGKYNDKKFRYKNNEVELGLSRREMDVIIMCFEQ